MLHLGLAQGVQRSRQGIVECADVRIAGGDRDLVALNEALVIVDDLYSRIQREAPDESPKREVALIEGSECDGGVDMLEGTAVVSGRDQYPPALCRDSFRQSPPRPPVTTPTTRRG
jgi:hypothetical protein